MTQTNGLTRFIKTQTWQSDSGYSTAWVLVPADPSEAYILWLKECSGPACDRHLCRSFLLL